MARSMLLTCLVVFLLSTNAYSDDIDYQSVWAGNSGLQGDTTSGNGVTLGYSSQGESLRTYCRCYLIADTTFSERFYVLEQKAERMIDMQVVVLVAENFVLPANVIFQQERSQTIYFSSEWSYAEFQATQVLYHQQGTSFTEVAAIWAYWPCDI